MIEVTTVYSLENPKSLQQYNGYRHPHTTEPPRQTFSTNVLSDTDSRGTD